MRDCCNLVFICITFHHFHYIIFLNSEEIDSYQSHSRVTLNKLQEHLSAICNRNKLSESPFNISHIKIGLAVGEIEVSEPVFEITAHSYLTLAWKDNRVRWNDSEYDEITVMEISGSNVWRPDIFLQNSVVDGKPITTSDNSNVTVFSNGEVLWILPVKVTSICEFDLYQWPFDIQRCYFNFYSWTYDGNNLELQIYNQYHVDLSSFKTHGWLILNSTAQTIVKDTDYCMVYGVASFGITIVRQSKFYKLIAVIPGFVFAVLILTQFCLSPHSKKRLISNCVIAVVILLFLSYFTKLVRPIGYKSPLIVTFYSASLFMICFAMVINVLVSALTNTVQPNTLQRIVEQHLQGTVEKVLLLDYNLLKNYNCPVNQNARIRPQLDATYENSKDTDSTELADSVFKEIIVITVDRLIFLIYIVSYVTICITYFVI